jgi:PTH1 family peptidyl-tRNA hydrolase
MSEPILAIVGLGNPGTKYEATRHNIGFWFVDELGRQAGGSELKEDKKFHSEIGKMHLGNQAVWLLKPQTFMNNSGRAVQALMSYYSIKPEQILVVHDELDLEPGVARLKATGGHGGHNGLRDIISCVGKDFNRLRLGIGHPGHRDQVLNYVLGKPGKDEQNLLDESIARSCDVAPDIAAGKSEQAMNQLHTKLA